MPRKKVQKVELDFQDVYHYQPLKFKIVPIENLDVIAHQRRSSLYHIKHLSASIERIGFIVPLVVVEANGKYLIIDGGHRYLAAKELGIRELPVIVVPQKLADLMMNFNIEKELNIREKAYVALSIYRRYLEKDPELLETDPVIIDSIEQAYYVTLGIAYEKEEKVRGGIFEPILKKCDIFLDEKLKEALLIRDKRAEKLIEANNLIKEIAEELRKKEKWHPFIYQQIISWANPYKRKRLPTDFDELFESIINKLQEGKENPEAILKEEIEEF